MEKLQNMPMTRWPRISISTDLTILQNPVRQASAMANRFIISMELRLPKQFTKSPMEKEQIMPPTEKMTTGKDQRAISNPSVGRSSNFSSKVYIKSFMIVSGILMTPVL
jgi:hypothetical protein